MKSDNLFQFIVTPTSKRSLPVSLRKHKDEADYHRAKKAGKAKRPLKDEEPIREWDLWKIIHNEYPYTAAFEVHHMLIPKRQTTFQDLTRPEKTELSTIIVELNEDYDCLMLNFQKTQSIGNHFHLHLMNYKKKRKDIKL